MVDVSSLLLGIIDPRYYYLITPLSLLIIGFLIKKRAKGETYVGRLTMFSNSMALFSFYAFVPHVPLWMIWIVNISIALGIIGIISYADVEKHLTKKYYKITEWFDSIYVGLLILIYCLLPSLFI